MVTMEDLISVIIPVYNAEHHLKKCVDSFINQSYSNFELILVNDGSKDNSLEICKSCSLNDSRIITLNKSNGGASSARNFGLDHMHGDYVIFADSDDFVSPDYLNNLYLAIKKGSFDIVQCGHQEVNDITFTAPCVSYSDLDLKEVPIVQALNCRKYKVCVWGKIYSKYLFANFRFKEGIIYEDDASYYQIAYLANKLGILDETLYFYYMSDNSVMRGDKARKRDKEKYFTDIYEERIAFFSEKNEDELVFGSYLRYCLVLIFYYANHMNTDNIDHYLELFRVNYKSALHLGRPTFFEGLLFSLFNFAPKPVGLIISLIRK